MVPARWTFSALSLVFASTLTLTAGPAAAQERAPTALPLRAARLYEVGLGYFERTGKLGKGTDLALPVPASHLDDALKTMLEQSYGPPLVIAVGLGIASYGLFSFVRARHPGEA